MTTTALLIAATGSANANLIVNGDFETIVGALPAAGGYRTINAGSTDITGWTVGEISVDIIKVPGYGAINSFSIDLAGSPGPGSLSQSFNAILGTTYTLNWDLSENGGTALTVDFLGNTTVYATGTVGPQSLSYVAQSTQSYELKFTSGSGNGGPVLDNIVVEAMAVPEPGTAALVLASLGMVGWQSRRRRSA